MADIDPSSASKHGALHVPDPETLSRWAQIIASWEPSENVLSPAEVERIMQDNPCWYIRDDEGNPVSFLHGTIAGSLEEIRSPKAIIVNKFRFAHGIDATSHSIALLNALAESAPEALLILVAHFPYEYAAGGVCGFRKAFDNPLAYLLYLQIIDTELADWDPPDGTIMLRPPLSLSQYTNAV